MCSQKTGRERDREGFVGGFYGLVVVVLWFWCCSGGGGGRDGVSGGDEGFEFGEEGGEHFVYVCGLLLAWSMVVWLALGGRVG